MFGFVSRTRKYETPRENRFKVGLQPDKKKKKHKLKEITTLNTLIGLLRWSRLPFAIKTASHVFQRAIEKIILGKVDNEIIYQDDICLGSCTREELKSKAGQDL